MKVFHIVMLAGLISLPCNGMDSSKHEFLKAVAQRSQTQNQAIMSFLALAAGVAVTELWKNLDHCAGLECSVSHYAPLIPGGILVAHTVISEFIRK